MKNKISKKLVISATVLTVVFCLLSIGAFYVLFYRKPIGKEITFPDFEGSYESDIPMIAGIKIQKKYIHSDSIPKGMIISQDPPPLSVQKVSEGQVPTLTLSISEGRESFALPDLSGMELRDAKILLRGMLCEMKIIRIYGDFEGELVSRTSPEPESEIYSGDKIILYVQTRKPACPVISDQER